MSDRFFVDTNVLAYLFDDAAPEKKERSEALIQYALDSKAGVISFQVVQEFFSLAFRRFTPPMSSTEAEHFLAMTLGPLLAIQSSYALYSKALQLTRHHSLSWYDALIVAAAIEGGCRILYTEDLQHGQEFDTLRVQNPFL
jgi:predicted nucleic acid-binding protein